MLKTRAIFIFISALIAFSSVVFPAGEALSQEALSGANENTDVMIEAIRRRSREIERREDILMVREEELLALRTDIEKKLKKLDEDTLFLEKILKELQGVDRESLAGLAKVYEHMAPDEAALRLEKLELEFAIRLLKAINSRKAGRILGYMAPDMAVKFSEDYGTSVLPDKGL